MWNRELDRVEGIQQAFIKRPLEDTPWAVQEPGWGNTQDGSKMDPSHEFLRIYKFSFIYILGVNCHITASGHEVPSSWSKPFILPLFMLLG